ncbi:hypothetical protein TRSC58_07498 [Trypanosoma rangeli SC58]|uniref:Secreted protein n=1 Tax=Trypanosoma rangeli SC58 TaxID=429131 RepID=A0A061IRX3_TRYRA|nr:hypothetical protein TRSC58_07498 [Trypanosoma rangeli SC58]
MFVCFLLVFFSCIFSPLLPRALHTHTHTPQFVLRAESPPCRRERGKQHKGNQRHTSPTQAETSERSKYEKLGI